jgi:hypothetical protein
MFNSFGVIKNISFMFSIHVQLLRSYQKHFFIYFMLIIHFQKYEVKPIIAPQFHHFV